MRKYALCIGFGVLLNLSFVNNAVCQMSFTDWKNNLKQLGNNIKQDALILGGHVKNAAIGVQDQIVTQSKHNINQFKNKTKHNLQTKRNSFFNSVANFANRLSTSTNQ